MSIEIKYVGKAKEWKAAQDAKPLASPQKILIRPPTTLKPPGPLDVFIDIEGMGVGVCKYKRRKRIRDFIHGIRSSLSSRGFRICTLLAVASSTRKEGSIGGHIQQEVISVFEDGGGVFIWSVGIADDILEQEVQDRADKGQLAPSILLMTNDGDFIGLTVKLIQAGHTVYVSGPSVNKSLQKTADCVIPFRTVARRKDRQPFNSVFPRDFHL